jgi:crotonobetainyl-CoA:carnitine CoA-transferase CaiB-like acyl-CoA transferase
MILADLGAEVIRIEDPNFIMGNPPPFYEGISVGAFNSILNRNKKSIGLNLKKQENGVLDVVNKLVEQTDIVVEGFRPGVSKKLGFDYDSLKKINKSIIYCSITGYGQTGPRSQQAGHDINYLGYSGILDLNRRVRKEISEPIIPCVQPADIGGALYAVIGILAALRRREVNPEKRGEYIDISMADSVFTMNPLAAAFEFTNTNSLDNILHGSHHPFYSVYQTKDGNSMAVGSIEPKFFTNLCTALGLPEFSSKQFSYGEERREIYTAFKKAFLSKTQNEWIKIFEEHEACVTPVRSFGEAMEDPQFQARGIVIEENHPSGKLLKNLANPIKFSSSEFSIRNSAPKVGENTEEILRSVGYTDEEIKALKKKRLFR